MQSFGNQHFLSPQLALSQYSLRVAVKVHLVKFRCSRTSCDFQLGCLKTEFDLDLGFQLQEFLHRRFLLLSTASFPFGALHAFLVKILQDQQALICLRTELALDFDL